MSAQMTTQEKALALHKEWNGKIETISKTPVKSREALSLAYTPRRCRALQGDCKRQGSRLPVHDESKHRSRRV